MAIVKSQGAWLLYEDDQVELVNERLVHSVFGSPQACNRFQDVDFYGVYDQYLGHMFLWSRTLH